MLPAKDNCWSLGCPKSRHYGPSQAQLVGSGKGNMLWCVDHKAADHVSLTVNYNRKRALLGLIGGAEEAEDPRQVRFSSTMDCLDCLPMKFNETLIPSKC